MRKLLVAVENGDASLSSTFKTFKSTAICIQKVDFDVNDLHNTTYTTRHRAKIQVIRARHVDLIE